MYSKFSFNPAILLILILASLSPFFAISQDSKNHFGLSSGLGFNGTGDIPLISFSGRHVYDFNPSISLLTRLTVAHGKWKDINSNTTIGQLESLEIGGVFTPAPNLINWLSIEGGLSGVHNYTVTDDRFSFNESETSISAGVFYGINTRIVKRELIESGINLRIQQQFNGDIISTLGLFLGARF